MKLLNLENNKGEFFDSTIYHFDSIDDINSIQSAIKLLFNDGYQISSFTINYECDHSNYNPPASFSNYEQFIDNLIYSGISEIETIDFSCKKNGMIFYSSLSLVNNCLKVRIPNKKEDISKII